MALRGYPRAGGLRRFTRQRKAEMVAMPKGVEIGYFGPSAIDALVNEYGVPGRVAERPAFRQAIAASLDAMRAEIAKRYVNGGISRADALAIGEILASELRRTVAGFTDPANLPWKPKSDPLVFTGRMLRSIDVRIIE